MRFEIVISTLIFSYSGLSLACTCSEFQEKLGKARGSLIEMMNGKKDEAQKKLVADTANIANSCIQSLEIPSGKESIYGEIKTNWSEFKNTREKELVPSILAGDDAKAKQIAGGIQKERKDRIDDLLSKLTAAGCK